MELIGLDRMLREAQANHYAVGAFNYCNAETAQAIAQTGCELRSPVMYIIGPIEYPLMGAKMMVDIIKLVAADSDVPVCLHLDHATSIDQVRECIEAGFPSVMMDASQYDFEENVRLTKMVVDMAHAKGITVEGELGAVGKVDDATVEGQENASLTLPHKAAEFVERTGIDALAISIGNAHGLYRQSPVLDFERLQAVRDATDVPLVLHGGSGTPVDQLHRAIDIGICKVNVASELGRAFLDAIDNFNRTKRSKEWYALSLVDAKQAVAAVVARWMRELGSTGRIS